MTDLILPDNVVKFPEKPKPETPLSITQEQFETVLKNMTHAMLYLEHKCNSLKDLHDSVEQRVKKLEKKLRVKQKKEAVLDELPLQDLMVEDADTDK